MAKPKQRSPSDAIKFLMESNKKWKETHYVIRTEYSVVERNEGYNTGGYYDEDIDATEKIVSPWYATVEEAQAWADKHEPEGYKPSFKIRPRYLRHVPATERWYDY